MSKPIAVCISDIHFNINNLELSSAALQAAIVDSNRLQLPLIVAGDLHDTKAIVRAEVANRLLGILGEAKTPVYLVVGNHDMISEKGTENSLNIYAHMCSIVRDMAEVHGITLIAYQNSTEAFLTRIRRCHGLVVCHQGVKGAFMGDYAQDKTSVDPDAFSHLKVISGHYHKHQTVGNLTYIGSPYTMSWGEANDGDKGYLILNDDGTYERVILGLRRHIILGGKNLTDVTIRSQDLVWVKIRDIKSALSKVKRKDIAAMLKRDNFKLDLIPLEEKSQEIAIKQDDTPSDILDRVITGMTDTPEHKEYLKNLWRSLL